MAVLTADKIVDARGGPAQHISVPMGVDIIYKGALVAIDSAGFAVPASDSATDNGIIGIAVEQVDNSGGSAGDLNVLVEFGRQYLLSAVSIVQGMVLEAMTVSDDDLVDDAGGPTNDVFVGYLTQFVSTTSGWVYVPGPMNIQA